MPGRGRRDPAADPLFQAERCPGADLYLHDDRDGAMGTVRIGGGGTGGGYPAVHSLDGGDRRGACARGDFRRHLLSPDHTGHRGHG